MGNWSIARTTFSEPVLETGALRSRVSGVQGEIGFIFQNFNLSGDFTAFEKVEPPLAHRGMRAFESGVSFSIVKLQS
jgi:ABC-type lipoprotein export system ATPase subunit